MIKVIQTAAAYPVTLAEAKEWCRIDPTDISQDSTINMLIAAMTEYAEHLTGRSYVERTLELSLSCFDYCIDLPWAPLLGIDSIKYTDINGAEQTVDQARYEVDTTSAPGKVRPVFGAAWPVIGYAFNPVRIQYRAGYAYPGSPIDLTDNSYLPAQLRLWIQARICTLFDTREQFTVGNFSVNAIPRDFADGLLDALVIGTRLF